MTDFVTAITNEFRRDYNVYECGFIKHRRKVFIYSREKNLGKVAAAFKQLKRKYRSAFFHTYYPFKKLAEQAVYAKNPLLEMIEKRQNFTGKTITKPVKFK